MGIADRILLMRRGELIQTGTPEELYRRPVDAEAARFFGEFNELTGRARSGKVETPLGVYPAEGFPEGMELAVMIRPRGLSGPASPGPVLKGCLKSGFPGTPPSADRI